MVASLPAASKHTTATARPLLAADVGGTHVRVGLVWPASGGQRLQVQDYRQYRCADHADLAAILRQFPVDPASLSACVIASAGHALADGTVISANLPWPLSTTAIRTALGTPAVHLVNDFEAVAHATAHIDHDQSTLLCGPAQAAEGPVLVVGAGTGLGAALRVPFGGRSLVLATEAGQAAFAATTELEIAVLQQLLRSRPHVSVEQALSGPGLLNLYGALCALRGQSPRHATPDAISHAACEGSDPLAVQTLELFCGLLGSAIGDMALVYGPHGGIYLAGGIAPRIGHFLANSTFADRFLNKGPMRKALERIPVRLVEHGQLGVIGAASWYLERRELEPCTPPSAAVPVHANASRPCIGPRQATAG